MRKASWNHCSSTRNLLDRCSVRCHALHDCHQTWSFQQAPSSKLINMRCGWALHSQCVCSTMSLHPTPPTHPNPTCYVASNMCATSTMSLHPTPPTHPNPTCYVASNMCATLCNFNDVFTPHPTHPPQPHVLRSIQHVCNIVQLQRCLYTPPHPPTQPNPRDRREGKCIDPTVYSGQSTFRNASLCPTGAKNKSPCTMSARRQQRP